MRGFTYSETVGKRLGRVSYSLEAPLLASAASVDGGLVVEIEGYRAENLGESQSFKFLQVRFGGKPFVETLDDGIERYTSSRDVICTVAFFNVLS